MPSRSPSMTGPKKARPASPERVRTPTLDVEQAIMQAATELLATEGAGALSIRRIASEAGVAPMSVYNRFGSKQGVVDALFIKGFQQLEEVMHVMSRGLGIEQDLVDSGHTYRAFAIQNPTLYALMFMRAVPDHEPSEDAQIVASRTFVGLVNAVTPWIEAGQIEQGDPVEIAQRIWELMHGAVSLELNGIGFMDDQAQHVENSSRMLARGLIAGVSKTARKPARTPSGKKSR